MPHDYFRFCVHAIIVNDGLCSLCNIFIFLIFAEGKIAPDEPAVLPPLPLVPKSEKRKSLYGTPQSKRLDYKDRDWDRERDRDFELMPPPGSLKKDFASPIELDQPIDPNEPTYCVCHQVMLLLIFILITDYQFS